MSEQDCKLMSFEIFNEIMNVPKSNTEISSDYQIIDYSSMFDIAPTLPHTFHSPHFHTSQHNPFQCHSRSPSTSLDIPSIQQQNTLLKTQLLNLKIQTQILKSNLQKLRIKKNGYQDLHKTIEMLESQLEHLSKEILNKDNVINHLRKKEENMDQKMRVYEFRIGQLEEQVARYERDIVGLHETVLKMNQRESGLLRDREYELREKERVMMDYVEENKELAGEVMNLKRGNDMMKDQIDKQHILILRYQKKGNTFNLSNTKSFHNQQSSFSSNFMQTQNIKKVFLSLKKQLVQTMRYINQQLLELKNSTISKILQYTQHHSSYIHSLQSSVIESSRACNEGIHYYKSQILDLRMELVETNMYQQKKKAGIEKNVVHEEQSKEEVRTCRKAMSVIDANQQNNKNCINYTEKKSGNALVQCWNQSTKMLKRQLWTNKKQVTRGEREVVSSRTSRKSIQECIMRTKKNK